MARIIHSLSEFAIIVEHIGDEVQEGAVESMRKTRDRVDSALSRAESQIGHLDRVGGATGYGTRKGARVGHYFRNPNLTTLIVKKRGPWQLVDNSVSGGPTKPHDIPVDLGNQRPLPPAKKYAPSLQFRNGNFWRQANNGVYHHDGSPRRPIWANFVQSVQPTITRLFGDNWNKKLREVIG